MTTPLILLHGALGSAEQFGPLRAALPHDRPVFALNLPGHGGSPLDHPFRMGIFARALSDFLDDAHLKTADVFGYSMGGYAALWLARNQPGKLRRIATLGTKFNWTPETAEREQALLNPATMMEKIPLFVDTLVHRHAPALWQEVVRRTSDLIHTLGHGERLEAKDLAAIDIPVLIGQGSLDKTVTPEESQEAARQLPQGRLQVFSGFKHPLESADPQVLAIALTDFFDAPEKEPTAV